MPNGKLYILQAKIGANNYWVDMKSHDNVIMASTINGIIDQIILAEFNPQELRPYSFQIVSREVITKDEVIS